jgi:DNA-binding response OmpR family regulator
MKSILVIERDGALQKILKRLFSAEGYEIDVVADGTAGLEMLRQRTPVAVILDIERSGNSECDLCKKIAKSIPNTPLVILSASSDAAHKVLFLGMGADDYVTIPFSPRELVPRLRALIRRASRFRQNRKIRRASALGGSTPSPGTSTYPACIQKPTLNCAFRRASRKALLWPEEAAIATGGSIINGVAWDWSIPR